MNLQIRHIPKEGMLYTLNKNSLLAGSAMISKETDNFKIEALQRNMLNLIQDLKSEKRIEGEDMIVLTEQDFESLHPTEMFKYVKTHAYEDYISKGKFRLGSLMKYRTVEDEKIKDVLEGWCGLDILSRGRHVMTTFTGGFNCHILCGTYTRNNDQQKKEQFGETVLRIKNPFDFASEISMMIGATSFDYQKVKYSTLKLYQLTNDELDVDQLKNQMFNEEFINYLLKVGHLPNVFVKPKSFEHEEELRLVFNMPSDIDKKDYFYDFDAPSLLSHIDVL